MWDHLLGQHLRIPRLPDGKWDLKYQPKGILRCRWDGCQKFHEQSVPTVFDIGMHLKMHMPRESKATSVQQRIKDKAAQEGVYETHGFHNTVVDERGDAAGIPLTALLVLRNLARNLPKMETPTEMDVSWTRKLFGAVEPQLWHVMAYNKSLAGYMADLMGIITAA
jgi:chromatin structure-remodeling complex subunit RSC9